MFNTPTTFAIGTGCSREYGLPLGGGLRNEIANLLENVKVEERRDRTDTFFMMGDERNGAVSVDMIDQTAGTFMADNGNYIRAGI